MQPLRVRQALFVAGCLLVASILRAQGAGGASIRGSVVTPAGIPVAGATVTLANGNTGARWNTVTGTAGRYVLDNLAVGGPYRLEARAIGYAPVALDSIDLHVGDQAERTLTLGDGLATNAAALATVVVRDGGIRDAGAGGAAYQIPGEAVRSLPLRDRNFVGLLWSTSAATPAPPGGSPSISGQHPRFNAIQVDGGSAGDFFGVNGSPTVNAGGKALSLEALEEIRILVAPFDVRQGGFSGGLINAVTRTGTNTFHGEIFTSFNSAEFVGTDTAHASFASFSQLQYGVSVGGPVIRDRLHYFAVADVQARQSPFAGPVTSDPLAGVSEATANRAAQVFRERYKFDAGGPEAPVLNQPSSNLFFKLSGQPSPNHWVELTQSLVAARSDAFNRVNRASTSDGWELSNSGLVTHATSATTRLRATSSAGQIENELIASHGTIHDNLDSRLRVPHFLVGADVAGTYLSGGSVRRAQGTETDQRIFELTDNVSWSEGRHQFTLGSQNQLLHFTDNLFPLSWGRWTFSSVDSLATGTAARYEAALPLRPGGPRADFSTALLSAYVQDRWNPVPGVTITLGLRGDVPLFHAPERNDVLLSNSALGHIDTGVFPSGNVVLSPRVGFAVDIGNHGATVLRGGLGTFAGRPPYVWLSSAYSNTGRDQASLVCLPGDGVPPPTTDIAQLPTRCTGSTPTPALPSVTVFDRGFRFQSATKLHLGIDHDFGGGTTVSLEAQHTATHNTVSVRDVNLVDRGLTSEGRTMYGDILTGATVRSARLDGANFDAVYQFSNVSGDRAISYTATLQRRWARGGLLQLGYTWSHTEDALSLAGFNGTVITQNNPIDGSLLHRNLRTSARDVPHNVVATAVIPMVAGFRASVFARARSGSPYAWVADGDANADNSSGNDLLYVPRDATDVSLTNPQLYPALDAFIKSEPCLRAQRGSLMRRNSCRNPDVRGIDGSLAKTIGIGGRQVELTVDLFNVPNIVNGSWGLVRQTASGETAARLLRVAGWDAQANRPRFTVPTSGGQPLLPGRNTVVPDSSRWRVQLGARFRY